MKTFFKSIHNQAEALQRLKQFERRTGVKWDAFSVRGGVQLTAIVTRETEMDEDAAIELLPHLMPDYESFVTLSERSGIPLFRVLCGAKTLAQTGKAVPSVNRLGHFSYIRAKLPERRYPIIAVEVKP